MTKHNRFPSERMVLENQDTYNSQCVAICSVASSAGKSCERRYLIILSAIALGGVGTVPVVDLARNNLKTRTSLRAVSTVRG